MELNNRAEPPREIGLIGFGHHALSTRIPMLEILRRKRYTQSHIGTIIDTLNVVTAGQKLINQLDPRPNELSEGVSEYQSREVVKARIAEAIDLGSSAFIVSSEPITHYDYCSELYWLFAIRSA